MEFEFQNFILAKKMAGLNSFLLQILEIINNLAQRVKQNSTILQIRRKGSKNKDTASSKSIRLAFPIAALLIVGDISDEIC